MAQAEVIFFGISGAGVVLGLLYEELWRREDQRKRKIAACLVHDLEIRYIRAVRDYKAFCRKCPFQDFASREDFEKQERREGDG